MNDIFKCGKCKKIFIAEEFDSHKCYICPKESKIIEIDYYTVHKDKEGNTFIITKTLDGILLTLKKSVSDGKLQWDKIKRSAEDFTEPYVRFCQVYFGFIIIMSL